MDVWNYILGYRNTLKSVFETWVVHIPFNSPANFDERSTIYSMLGRMSRGTSTSVLY